MVVDCFQPTLSFDEHLSDEEIMKITDRKELTALIEWIDTETKRLEAEDERFSRAASSLEKLPGEIFSVMDFRRESQRLRAKMTELRRTREKFSQRKRALSLVR